MSENQPKPTECPAPLTQEERRNFVKRASKYAVGVPTAALLLQAASMPARAQGYSPVGPPPSPPPGPLVPSDRRLKTDIVREGTLPNGLAVYSYRYTFSRKRFVGVMADEVQAVMPQAVSVHRSGYKMVDYAMVFS